uniref:DDE_Tnp_1_7 domain-containing protein n=1 Tax=Rhabditophanes sp. KR3021 TaxID=114890 RepID=A0AC35U3S4_9BILA
MEDAVDEIRQSKVCEKIDNESEKGAKPIEEDAVIDDIAGTPEIDHIIEAETSITDLDGSSIQTVPNNNAPIKKSLVKREVTKENNNGTGSVLRRLSNASEVLLNETILAKIKGPMSESWMGKAQKKVVAFEKPIEKSVLKSTETATEIITVKAVEKPKRKVHKYNIRNVYIPSVPQISLFESNPSEWILMQKQVVQHKALYMLMEWIIHTVNFNNAKKLALPYPRRFLISSDFINLLKSGQILQRLANKLKANSILDAPANEKMSEFKKSTRLIRCFSEFAYQKCDIPLDVLFSLEDFDSKEDNGYSKIFGTIVMVAMQDECKFGKCWGFNSRWFEKMKLNKFENNDYTYVVMLSCDYLAKRLVNKSRIVKKAIEETNFSCQTKSGQNKAPLAKGENFDYL